MHAMRPSRRAIAIAATVAAGALCAGPAMGADRGHAADARVKPSVAVKRVAEWAKQTGREERHRVRAAEGPFVPLVGPIDYGTAENAFGAARSDHVHAGQDMFAKPGTPEIAVTDAVVAETGNDGGQGNFIYLYDAKRDRTYVYMHMIAPAVVNAGERVHAGQLLGREGCTGSCWGDHLHFEVRDGRGYEGEARDPMPLLADWRPLDRPR